MAVQVSDRAQRLTEALPGSGVDVLLITDLANVRYLTGYYGTNALTLVGPQTRSFITDFRYVQQAAEQVDGSFHRQEAPLELMEAIADELPVGQIRLGFEESHMSVRQHARLREVLPDWVSLVACDGLVERLREVKEPAEIVRIQAAAELADAAFSSVVADGLVGRTEADVALALDVAMRRRGATQSSFPTIVAAGPHGALPHAAPRPVPIEPGQLVVIDWGAELDGYCSDCTRTVACGEPDELAREVYGLVLEAQLAGLQAVRAGAGCRQVDGVARQVIEAAGRAEEFGHGLGHGVGIEVHEGPRLSFRAAEEDRLSVGNVVTVEPGVYFPGEFGVRIEDLVAVTDDGGQILTSLPKELQVVN